MSVVENSGLMKYKDSSGNTNIMYPITLMDNVDGLEEALAEKAASSHTHDDRYYTESEMNTKLSGKSDTGHTHIKSEITDFPSSMPASDVSAWAKASTKPTYTASEVGADASGAAAQALTDAKAYTDTAVAGKADSSHTHDDRYYTESEVDTKLAAKSDTGHTHSAASTSAAGFMSASDKSKLDGIATGATKVTVDTALSSSSTNPVQNKVIDSALTEKADNTDLVTTYFAASSSDGATYTATVSGVTLTAGHSFIMVPNYTSTTTTPTLNVNSLGAKNLRIRGGDYTGLTAVPANANWLASGKPVRVTYDGLFWVADLYASAEPEVTYGTSDLTAGTSALATGKLYVVYE